MDRRAFLAGLLAAPPAAAQGFFSDSQGSPFPHRRRQASYVQPTTPATVISAFKATSSILRPRKRRSTP